MKRSKWIESVFWRRTDNLEDSNVCNADLLAERQIILLRCCLKGVNHNALNEHYYVKTALEDFTSEHFGNIQ